MAKGTKHPKAVAFQPKGKQPAANAVTQRGIKEPRATLGPSFRGGPLAWRFGSADKSGPFAWTGLQDGNYRRVMERLHDFESMEQAAIVGSGSHPIEVSQLSKDAKDRLEAIHLDDLDGLMSFRITGKERVFCRVHGSIMSVLWWDPEHQVCISQKKHT